jgi:GH15 family glucan-1,4-alpha-glucosidase
VRRRLVLGSVAAIAVAMAAQLGAGQAEPLPTLRNGPEWRASTAAMSAADLAWLERGIVPGGPEHRDLVVRALIDLRGLTQPNGAVAGGPDGPWAYAWPRDNSFVAVAYAVSGHPDDAWRTLRFFVDAQLEDGGFEARYRLDGAGAPDDRQRQTDGAGWLLWAIDAVSAASGEAVPADLRPLRDRATEHLLRLTAGGRELPPASPDYWEVPERRVTLGTVAPLAAGLEASARGYSAEGDSERSVRLATAAAAMRSVIGERFGPDYERHGDRGGLDAAAAMMLPPFAAAADPDVIAAVDGYARQAIRPAGGLAPGVGWKTDGLSWTPETALVAYTAAAADDVATATGWRDWLARHTTDWGSLPEKVLPDGSPAGPAPLAWTAALFILTQAELAGI